MSGAGACHWESSLFISRHGFLPSCLSIVANIRRSEDNNNPRGTFSPYRAPVNPCLHKNAQRVMWLYKTFMNSFQSILERITKAITCLFFISDTIKWGIGDILIHRRGWFKKKKKHSYSYSTLAYTVIAKQDIANVSMESYTLLMWFCNFPKQK